MNLSETLTEVLNFDVAGITVNKVLSAVLLLVVCLIVVKILLKIVDKILVNSKLEKSLHTFVRTVVKVVLLFLTVLVVADSIGIPITSLIAVLSVFGLAVSLAVQNSLSNVAGGIQVLASKPFKVGDYVQAGGVEGTVNDIGIFYTKLNTGDNKLIQVPNSEIANEKIVNYSAEAERRVDLTFAVSYDAPVETVKKIIKEVIGTHALTQTKPEPVVRVSGYKDSCIEYIARAWCANGDYWTVYFDILEQVKAAFDQAGVEMTYPHINVHMVNTDKA